MLEWIKKNLAYIGVVVTILIGLYPTTFVEIGNKIKNFMTQYWLHLAVVLIIWLLASIYWHVVRRE